MADPLPEPEAQPRPEGPTVEIRDPVVTVEDLSLHYGQTQALFGVDLRIPARQVTALIGPSGCGKSTLLRCLNRLNDLIDDVHISGRVHLLGEDIEAVAKQAADKGIRIDVDLPSGLMVRCDRRLTEQALINVVDNAVKYTGEGGRVHISARRLAREAAVLEQVGDDEAADAVVIEVADTGIGIPSQEVERVFERFYRVDKGRSRSLGGTGLGLSIVRHIIELHGERVFVNSHLGTGSVFGFTLRAA